MTWRIVLQLALSGLSIGSIYALVGLALVLPFKASGIVNFAQGEIVTFGAYLALILSGLGLPYLAVVPLVLVGAAVFGMAIERFVDPADRKPARVHAGRRHVCDRLHYQGCDPSVLAGQHVFDRCAICQAAS